MLACLIAMLLIPGPVRLTQRLDESSSVTSDGSQHIASPDYRLGPGDVIDVAVFNTSNLAQTLRVSSSGSITMPFLGKVAVSGLTGDELEIELASRLKDSGLVRDPQVSVFIREFNSQPVFVLGAVRLPGQYVITQPLQLVQVLAMAGGLDPIRAADYMQFQRRGKAGAAAPVNLTDELQGENVRRIDLKKLLELGEEELNLPVQGGDVIFVPERPVSMFYVVGEVNHPGAFQLPDEGDLLLSQALAQAGGPMKTAKIGKGMLVRYDEHGRRQEVAVNFSDILRGKKPDLTVQRDDVIFIPGSNFKTIGYGLLGTIPGTVSGTVIYGASRGAR